MNILIIEDELPAAKRLTNLIKAEKPEATILEIIDSVEAATAWLKNFPAPDLIFMDIQLADGLSFDIFTHANISSPVIFTTAYDQYTLKAFKVNSVDYLLKPIDPEELQKAFVKFEKFYNAPQNYDKSSIEQLLQSVLKKEYKERFLVKIGQNLTYISVKDIAFFYSEDGCLHAQNISGKRHILDYTLDQLEQVLDPSDYFRINRKFIIKVDSIQKISTWFNSRLKLELRPKPNGDIIVSRERVGDFKQWLDK